MSTSQPLSQGSFPEEERPEPVGRQHQQKPLPRLRILLISNYYPPFELGGWEQLTQEVTDRLRQKGHHIQVLTSHHRTEEIVGREKGIIRQLHLQSPDPFHYHPHYTLLSPLWELSNRRCLERVVLKFRPDVIFIQGMWNLSRRLPVHAENLRPNRVLYYIASPWPTDENPHEAYWADPAGKRALRAAKHLVGGIVRRTLLSRTPQQPSFPRLLCVSEFMRNYIQKSLGLPEAQTFVVHNGIDLSRFNPGDGDAYKGPLRLLYAGGILPHKGVLTALEAMDELVNRKNVRNLTLDIVGHGHPDYVERLRQFQLSAGLSNVRFQDSVTRDRMPELLRQYDVLVFPATGPEALARIVQEAMACGLVVIGTETGGTPEILVDQQNGLTFEAGNSAMLADKISLLMSQPSLRDRLSRAARKTVETHFTLDRMVMEVEQHLNEVAGK